MPEFIYKAVDTNGIYVKSKVQEKSKPSLVKRLKINGLTPIEVIQVSTKSSKTSRVNKENLASIEELMKIENTYSENSKNKKSGRFSAQEKINMALSRQEKVTSRDLVIFTQNFYLLKKAGFNNVHALSTLIESTENITLKGILEDVLSGVESGNYMYTTMEYYNEFPYIYVNLIKVGELSGSLEESLRQAVQYLETSSSLNKKLKSIIIPNVAQFIILFVILIVGSLYIVPIIQGVFEQVGSSEQLPWYTLAFSSFLNKAQKHWYIAPLIIGTITIGITMYVQTPKGKYNWHYFKYKMPIFGKLIFSIDFSRLTNAMLLNLKNGMRIQEALDVSKNVVKNYVMLSIIETAINNIIIGESWVKPFEESGLASPMITEMLKIGMQTDLSAMMEKLVEYMSIDIDNIIQRIIKVLPQVLYTFVGILIIFITLVVLVPCIQVYMGTFLFSAAGV